MAVINVKNIQNPVVFPVGRKLRGSTLVVLFTDYRSGVVLVGSSDHAVGEYKTVWAHCKADDWQPVEVTING